MEHSPAHEGGNMRKAILLLVLCAMLCALFASIDVEAEEGSTIFVAFGCAPGYTGGAEVTLTSEEGKQYTVTVSAQNGWGIDVAVEPGTYTAQAEVVNGAEGDICFIDENTKELAPGQTDSFAGVVGNEWDVIERATIIQRDAVGEDGRQTIYGELEEEDIYAFFDSQQQASEERKQQAEQQKEENEIVEPDAPDTEVVIEDKTDDVTGEEEEQKEESNLVLPVIVAAFVLLAAAVFIVVRKNR